MEYTVFRNLKRHRLLKDLEEEYIHEKRRKYDNEATENDFVRSCLVTTTEQNSQKAPLKKQKPNSWKAVVERSL